MTETGPGAASSISPRPPRGELLADGAPDDGFTPDGGAASSGAPDPARALMLRFQQGDEAAFTELVHLCKRDVFALGYRYGLTPADADDLGQEVFLRVYRARDSYRPGPPFRAWLLRIASNLVISEARKRKLRRAASLSALRGPDGEGPLEIEDRAAPAPWARLTAEERRAALDEALARLPETQRVALLLNRFHDQSYEEVGAALELSIPAVKSLLFRARQSLKTALEGFMRDA